PVARARNTGSGTERVDATTTVDGVAGRAAALMMDERDAAGDVPTAPVSGGRHRRRAAEGEHTAERVEHVSAGPVGIDRDTPYDRPARPIARRLHSGRVAERLHTAEGVEDVPGRVLLRRCRQERDTASDVPALPVRPARDLCAAERVEAAETV